MRKLIRLIFVAGMVYIGWKLFESKRAEFVGLTESEAKAKLREKLIPRVGPDTAEQIVNQVVPRLRERGIVQPDPV